jgi:RimJ/RimL family protein N-acetyltransferase
VSFLDTLKRENKYSIFSRSGFVEERRERKYNWDDGKWLDLIFMAILEKEWTAYNK